MEAQLIARAKIWGSFENSRARQASRGG